MFALCSPLCHQDLIWRLCNASEQPSTLPTAIFKVDDQIPLTLDRFQLFHGSHAVNTRCLNLF